MSSRFTTRTGQTGPDAYEYEAAQIANALRELDARAASLAAAMAAELPADVCVRWSIASDAFPDAWMPADRDSLAKMLPFNGTARDVHLLADVARALRDPSHVVDRPRAES